jgi:hypothetical protein
MKRLIIMGLALFNISCIKQQHAVVAIPKNINRELIGKWANDTGCSLEFGIQNQHLHLIKFVDAKNYQISNADVVVSKYGVATNMYIANIKWSASYFEGDLIVNHYCDTPLHKEGV